MARVEVERKIAELKERVWLIKMSSRLSHNDWMLIDSINEQIAELEKNL